MRRFGTRPCFWFVLSLAVCALVLGGCAEQAPQDYLNEPLGEQAQEADALWDIAFPIAVGIFFVVEGLLVYALIRFRHKPGREAAEFHGNTRLEVALTVIPALILGGVSIPTLRTLFNITSTPTGANVVEATVIGHQFWWEYRYTDVPGVPEISEEDPLVTANELHIPTGTPVRLKLIGAPDDVIHSFWPPKIAGKQDVVPGRENQVTLETNVEGRYWGQCGEYCGDRKSVV